MRITEVKTKKDLLEFIKFPFSLYKADPMYSPLPITEQKKHFNPAKNPFYKDARVKLFLLEKDGRISGRIASVIDERHLACHGDGAGFFGFYESVNDASVAGALLDRVEAELKEARLTTMRGPMSFSTNDEFAFQTEGFSDPPMIMTPYNPPWYNDLMAACGMKKAKDLLAYIRDMALPLPEKVRRVAALAEKKGVGVRLADMKKLNRELSVFRDVYNSSWKDNWGFIPITPDEVDVMAEQLKGVLLPELTIIAEAGEGPVGFLGIVPDVNQVLRVLRGRMTPLGIMKALYRFRRIDALRLMLLGVKKEWRGRGVEALMIRQGFEGIKKSGDKYKRIEFSWILEDNLPIMHISEMIGGHIYKRYRVYEREISA
ncbi:MAG: hypothetical protein M0Z58_10530 [Nitrospiraceae bacterium]|nr:hypothetical protein [Nitrospiraceae bacterium]